MVKEQWTIDKYIQNKTSVSPGKAKQSTAKQYNSLGQDVSKIPISYKFSDTNKKQSQLIQF